MNQPVITHWSKYQAIVHVGPVEGCELCEEEQVKFEEESHG